MAVFTQAHLHDFDNSGQVRLFTEEVDKITSLVIGLSSRLAKASLLPPGQQDEKLQVIKVILLPMLMLVLMLVLIPVLMAKLMLILMPRSSLLVSSTKSCMCSKLGFKSSHENEQKMCEKELFCERLQKNSSFFTGKPTCSEDGESPVQTWLTQQPC